MKSVSFLLTERRKKLRSRSLPVNLSMSRSLNSQKRLQLQTHDQRLKQSMLRNLLLYPPQRRRLLICGPVYGLCRGLWAAGILMTKSLWIWRRYLRKQEKSTSWDNLKRRCINKKTGRRSIPSVLIDLFTQIRFEIAMLKIKLKIWKLDFR